MIELAGGQLHHGDCLEVMDGIPDGSIDMILADLPYALTNCHWDSLIPLQPLWGQYTRVIKNDGAIILTGSQPFTSLLVMSNPKLFRYDLIWEKTLATGFLNANRMPLRAHEHILVFYKKLGTFNPQKIKTKQRVRFNHKKSKGSIYSEHYKPYEYNNGGEAYPRSVLVFRYEDFRYDSTKPQGNNHPTQKPVSMFEYLIRTYTNEGETVLDNVIGSGTTAVAAFRTGRQWIGIEKDDTIFEMCHNRIVRDTRQQVLIPV